MGFIDFLFNANMKRGIFWTILGIAAFLIIYVLLIFFLLTAEPKMMVSPQIEMARVDAGGYFCELVEGPIPQEFKSAYPAIDPNI